MFIPHISTNTGDVIRDSLAQLLRAASSERMIACVVITVLFANDHQKARMLP